MTEQEISDSTLRVLNAESFGESHAEMRRIIQSALTFRTEQCVLICDAIEAEAVRMIKESKQEANAQYEKGKGLCAARIRAKIRALNQPSPTEEKK